MLTSTQSAGVTPDMNLRITQARKHAKGIHHGVESQGRCHQKSKTGVSVAPRKGLMSSKKLQKKKKINHNFLCSHNILKDFPRDNHSSEVKDESELLTG